jgi:undecaprenyl-diphosphatase
MLPLLQAAFLGVVQGITEFLPVSSTAHLLISEKLIGFHDPDGVFTVMIQLGSILAIMWLYRAKILDVVAGLSSRPEARHFALTIIVATIPAALAGAFLSGFVKGVLYQTFSVIAVAFIIGGIIMLLVERFRPKPSVTSVDDVPVSRAFVIGACQALALIPGVSRSGGTIVGALALGLDRATAAEFSFFLAMPTMAAAFGKQVLEVRHHLGTERALEISIGFVMAFISSILVVRPFLNFVRRSGFAPFAWYRIVLGVGVFAAIFAGWL